MQQHEIQDYIEKYFTANECDIRKVANGCMEIQLTVEMDKLLMNRPFYWHYLEKTGGIPNPMKIVLQTEPGEVEGVEKKPEFIHFGSPRLHQLFQTTKELGAFMRLYEDVNAQKGIFVPLEPWLCLNVKVSYQCDRKKDHLYSIGLQLINGMIKNDFHDYIETLSLTPRIPDYCYTMSPLIKPVSGFKRIENYLEQEISNDDHTWADEARERLKDDQELLEHFYESAEEIPDTYEVEMEALKELYDPKVKIEIINGGMFYLAQRRMM